LPSHISSNSDERKRFEIEAKAAAALNHPNIATIHAIDAVDKEMFIVMEYIDGEELKVKLRSGPLDLNQATDIAQQIARGLEAAHEKNIIHRDIKSTNIMITKKGQVKIMDFGLAKVREGAELTQEQSTIGTAAYMSPEQAGGNTADHRSDIWSFGVVLYEMLTGKLPFKADYDQAIIYAILNENLNFDEDIKPDIPAALQQIIIQILQKNPDDRYQNVAGILADIKNLKNSSDSKSQITTTQSRTLPKIKKLTPLYYGIGIVIAMITALYFLFLSNGTELVSEAEQERKMIVVLPFENLGPAEDEYFADGLAEEITSRLSSFPELGVIARTSAIQYKNTSKKIDQIGEELNVDYVLEGTVRWDRTSEGPSRIRVTPQLIRVTDATHLWSDRYDKVIDDIFSVQSDIAEKVIAQLDITLLESNSQFLRKKPTENIEAYTEFLKGQQHIKYFGVKHVRLGIQFFEKAISLDPEFVKAISYLSRAYSMMVHFGYDKSNKRRDEAKNYAETALRLAPNDPDSHIAMAYYHYWVNRAYDLAEQEFAIAEKYQPNNADILAGRAFVQRRQGRWEESITNLKKSLELSPLNAIEFADLGYTFTMLRRYQEAVPYYENSIEIDSYISFGLASKCENILRWRGDLQKARQVLSNLSPKDDLSYLVWIRQYIYEKKYQLALNLLSEFKMDMINHVTYVRPKMFLRGWIYFLNNESKLAHNEFKAAKILLEEKIQEKADDFRLHSALGLTYAALGEKEKAIEFGRTATKMYSDSIDALDGSFVILDLAWIYTLTGEYDAALEKLGYLLSIPSYLSVPLIRIDPKWDTLRSHPKYQSLLEKYSDE
jgi:TolB-like protein/Tfp pilus assembly protein PilF